MVSKPEQGTSVKEATRHTSEDKNAEWKEDRRLKEKWQKDLNRDITKEIQMANKLIK